MRMGIYAGVVSCVAVRGCAAAVDSGVMPLGPDTYRMQVGRAGIMGGGMEAQKVALSEAQQYCNSQKREFVLNAQRWQNPNRFEIDFRCLKTG